MLFTIFTRNDEILRKYHIDGCDKGRLFFIPDNDIKYNDYYLFTNDGFSVYQTKPECYEPILNKICLVVFSGETQQQMLDVMLLDREITTIDGVPFISKFLRNGEDVTDEIVALIQNSFVVVYPQETALETHRCSQCGNLYVGERCEPCYRKRQEEMRKVQEEYAKNHPKEVEANRIRWARVAGFMPADFHDLGDDGRFTSRGTGGETFTLHILLSEEQYGLLMQNSLWMRTRHMLASPLNTYYTRPVKNDHTAQQYRKLTEFNISGYKEDLEELLRKIYMLTK